MRQGSSLTCSSRDTEDMGVRPHCCRTTGLHPCPPQAPASLPGTSPRPPSSLSQAPGTASVGSSFARRGSARCRQRTKVLAGTEKGKNNSHKFFQRSSPCSRHTRRELHKAVVDSSVPVLIHSLRQVLYYTDPYRMRRTKALRGCVSRLKTHSSVGN